MGYNLHPVLQVLLYHQGIHYPTFLLTCFAKTVFEWADCQRQTSYNPYNTAEWLVYPVWKLVLKPCTYRKGHVPSGAGITRSFVPSNSPVCRLLYYRDQ